MKTTILLKSVTIIDPNSPFNKQVKDILIENGMIVNVANNIKAPSTALIIKEEGLHVCPGLFDLLVDFGEPGFEHKETLETGCNAAMHGGFTGVGLSPNSEPPRDNKSAVEFCINKSAEHLVDLFPMGTISKGLNGKELSEMFDLKSSGAIAYFDGKKPIESAGLMARALLYTKNFDGLVFSFPYDSSLSVNGQMNESIESTKLGLQGIPAIAEELQMSRDLFLASYNEAKIHFTTVSSQSTVPMLLEAKQNNINVSSSVAIHNLILTDDSLREFDSNYKVLPPLRTQDDKNALIEGLKNGIVDVITSDHTPQDIESKKMEFSIADFGIIGTQTAFPLAVTHLSKSLGLEEIVVKMSINPRTILQLDTPVLNKGFQANITLFNPNKEFIFTKENNKSLSENSPFLDTALTCKVVGVINGGKYHLND
jgi:dihydroorotase